MDLYAENILDHYRNPRSKVISGQWTVDSDSVVHEEKNISCGDAILVYLKVEDDCVKDIEWDGTGCAISQAGMSMMTEELIGKSCDHVLGITKEEIYEMFGVPIGPRRFKCALLCLHTLKNALRKFKGEEVQGWLDTVGED